jgi:hypothetical protein
MAMAEDVFDSVRDEIGHTGRKPVDTFGDDEKGEAKHAVAAVNGMVLVHLGAKLDRLGFTPAEARTFAAVLKTYAAMADEHRNG